MTIKIELEFIPVAERLPEKEGTYLCLYAEGGPAFVWFPSASFSSMNLNQVTHWAKIPDLSKAKEEKPKPPPNHLQEDLKNYAIRIFGELSLEYDGHPVRKDIIKQDCIKALVSMFEALRADLLRQIEEATK